MSWIALEASVCQQKVSSFNALKILVLGLRAFSTLLVAERVASFDLASFPLSKVLFGFRTLTTQLPYECSFTVTFVFEPLAFPLIFVRPCHDSFSVPLVVFKFSSVLHPIGERVSTIPIAKATLVIALVDVTW